MRVHVKRSFGKRYKESNDGFERSIVIGKLGPELLNKNNQIASFFQIHPWFRDVFLLKIPIAALWSIKILCQ
jgi:hypothetical protein